MNQGTTYNCKKCTQESIKTKECTLCWIKNCSKLLVKCTQVSPPILNLNLNF